MDHMCENKMTPNTSHVHSLVGKDVELVTLKQNLENNAGHCSSKIWVSDLLEKLEKQKGKENKKRSYHLRNTGEN